MDAARKRSVVWGFFKSTDSESVQCLLCSSLLSKHSHGSTTPMLRHLRVKHPTVVCRESIGRVAESTTSNDTQDMDIDGEQFCSVEVELEDGDADIVPVKETDVNSADTNGLLDVSQEGPAEQITRSEASYDRPVLRAQHKRSLIWRYFELLDSLNAARCRICMKKLQYSYGGTSNLRRHLSKRHPKVFSELVANRQQPPPLNTSQDSKSNGDTDEKFWTEQRQLPVEVVLEDGDSDTITAVNEAGVNSADTNGLLDVSQEGPTEQITRAEASDDHPVLHAQHKRSLIWRYFEHLDSLNAARCRICMKKLQYSYGRTSNLSRHMSKRHPEVFSELVANRQQPPPLNTSLDLKNNGDTDEKIWATDQRQAPGASKVSGGSEGERRMFRRERELIEALRRTQKEEARALEHQRELLEKLREADAREAAAEREKIETLRKAQQEEAKELSRQREELQKEKAELQKKREEFQQEKEGLLDSGPTD